MMKKGVLWLFGIYILILIGFYFLQEKIIFQSKKLDKNFSFSIQQEFEEVALPTEDNASINALHFRVENPKGVILYFHGNKGSLKRWSTKVLPLTNFGYDLFVIDYRGYGKSRGKRSEKAFYQDAELAYEYVRKTFDEQQIVVYGRSLGCTFATHVASKNRPKQLILEAPFYSLLDAMHDNFPLLPYKQLLKYKFETSKLIPEVRSPTLIFHGDKDRLISIRSGKKLYEASRKDQTEFVVLKKGTHHNLSSFEIYQGKIKSLLN